MHGEEEEAARERRVRSHTARASILALLGTNEQELTEDQIRAGLGEDLTARNVSYHLRVLMANRLVVEEEGRYRLM